MTNIVEYVFTTFPTNDNTLINFKNYCLQFTDVDTWNWKDFTQKLSDFLFNNDNTISISNSSLIKINILVKSSAVSIWSKSPNNIYLMSGSKNK